MGGMKVSEGLSHGLIEYGVTKIACRASDGFSDSGFSGGGFSHEYDIAFFLDESAVQ